jgi:hypothetical protein
MVHEECHLSSAAWYVCHPTRRQAFLALGVYLVTLVYLQGGMSGIMHAYAFQVFETRSITSVRVPIILLGGRVMCVEFDKASMIRERGGGAGARNVRHNSTGESCFTSDVFARL